MNVLYLMQLYLFSALKPGSRSSFFWWFSFSSATLAGPVFTGCGLVVFLKFVGENVVPPGGVPSWLQGEHRLSPPVNQTHVFLSGTVVSNTLLGG